MAQNPQLEAAFAKIRELFAAEHRKGEQSMMTRMTEFLQGKEGATAPTVTPIVRTGGGIVRLKRLKNKKERAPEGTVRKLVERVLREQNGHRTGPKDIQRAAITPEEKLVSYSGIRFELDRGRTEGRYTGSGDKWKIKEAH